MTKEKCLMRSEFTDKKVRIDQWSGSELTNGQGPNCQGPNKIGFKLTKAELDTVRITHVPVLSIPCSLKTVNNTSEKIREVRIFNDFLKFTYQISIEFWIRNLLLQKFLQIDIMKTSA